MTPTERSALIAEAKRRAAKDVGVLSSQHVLHDRVIHNLLDLIESNWRPEPEVDAVTLAAREWGALCEPFYRENYMSGAMDDEVHVQAFRAGHAHALANCADVKRMDWLSRQALIVDGPVRNMAALITHAPDSAETLATKIDRAMVGE